MTNPGSPPEVLLRGTREAPLVQMNTTHSRFAVLMITALMIAGCKQQPGQSSSSTEDQAATAKDADAGIKPTTDSGLSPTRSTRATSDRPSARQTPESTDRATRNVEIGRAKPAASPLKTGTAIKFEPEILSLGEMLAGVPKTGTVTLVNITDEPVLITQAKPGCGCTTLGWPKDPIPPGESADIDITLKPGVKLGVSLNKKVTFMIDGYAPQVLSVTGDVAQYVMIEPDVLNAPDMTPTVSDVGGTSQVADGADETTEIRLTATDDMPFKILSATPPIILDMPGEASTEHVLEIDWPTWNETGKSVKVAIATDHPKAPTLSTLIKRSARDRRRPIPPTPKLDNRANRMPNLLMAARTGNIDQLRLEIANGADLNVLDPESGRTALHHAARKGDYEMAQLLVEKDIRLDAGDRSGKTALTLAAENGHKQLVAMLIESGADVNTRDMIGGSPVLWAAGLGSFDTVSQLLEAGADVNIVDVNGMTPLHWAASVGGPDSVNAIIKAGAKIDNTDNISGDTPLMRAARSGKLASMVLLVDAGADLSKTDVNGQNAFLVAAASGDVDKIKVLVDAGSDIQSKDTRGWNAMDHASNRTDANRQAVMDYLNTLAISSENGDDTPDRPAP
ncbi:MAG: hypothetical protein CMJ32_04875 [Phycisphaerae bacterium]|nr:hypothetical protein [Phycisphaerae bacterium]